MVVLPVGCERRITSFVHFIVELSSTTSQLRISIIHIEMDFDFGLIMGLDSNNWILESEPNTSSAPRIDFDPESEPNTPLVCI